MRQSNRLTLFDLAEFETVPDSLKQDYVNKTVPVIQDVIKTNLTEKGLLDKGSIIANSIVYLPCRVAKAMGGEPKKLPGGLCDNFCEGDGVCLKKDSDPKYDLTTSRFCNNLQCQKVSDNDCKTDSDCVFENSGKLQVCGDDKKCKFAGLCEKGKTPNPFNTPDIYDKKKISCNTSDQPVDVELNRCYAEYIPTTIPIPFTKLEINKPTCDPQTQVCHIPDGKFYGSCLNKP